MSSYQRYLRERKEVQINEQSLEEKRKAEKLVQQNLLSPASVQRYTASVQGEPIKPRYSPADPALARSIHGAIPVTQKPKNITTSDDIEAAKKNLAARTAKTSSSSATSEPTVLVQPEPPENTETTPVKPSLLKRGLEKGKELGGKGVEAAKKVAGYGPPPATFDPRAIETSRTFDELVRNLHMEDRGEALKISLNNVLNRYGLKV
jgi:hypothetical protein